MIIHYGTTWFSLGKKQAKYLTLPLLILTFSKVSFSKKKNLNNIWIWQFQEKKIFFTLLNFDCDSLERGIMEVDRLFFQKQSWIQQLGFSLLITKWNSQQLLFKKLGIKNFTATASKQRAFQQRHYCGLFSKRLWQT